MCSIAPLSAKRRDRAAVAVGAEEQLVFRGQQQLAGLRVDRRHRALAENNQVVFGKPEPLVLVEEIDLLVVRDGAGHHVDRHRRAVATGCGERLFQMDLQERRARHRSDRIHALGLVETEPAALPSGREQHANFAGRQRLLAASSGFVG